MSKKTKVLFPRFQYETNPQADIGRRELKWLVEPEHHLDKAGLSELTAIKEVEKRISPYRINTPWWGEWHTHGYTVSEVQEVPGATTGNIFERFRITRIDHGYSWDSQSAGGSAQEVVLEGEDEGRFTVIAALLAIENSGFKRWGDEGQRFVTVHADVPEAPLPDEIAYLDVMRRVATQGAGLVSN